MAATAIIAGEIIAAILTGVSEYLRAAGVAQEEIDKIIQETVERVKKKDPSKLLDKLEE